MKKNAACFIILIFAAYLTFGQNSFSLSVGDSKVSEKEELKSLFLDHPDYAKRYRPLKINPAIQQKGVIVLNDTLLMELFPGEEYKAVIEKSTEINGNPSYRAKITGFDYGWVFMSSDNGKSLITIEIPERNKLFRVEYNPSSQKHFLIEVDKTKRNYIEDSPPIIPPENNEIEKNKTEKDDELKLKSAKSEQKTDADLTFMSGDEGPVTINILIVYTPAAANWASNYEGGINNTIANVMNKSQLALDNSNTNISLNLVYSGEVNYNEMHDSNDLYNLRNNYDGYMDEVHSWRDTYAADVVVLLEETGFTGGLGYLLMNEYGSPGYAFSLTRIQQASWTYTVIHEIGHNMGAHHHKGQIDTPDGYSGQPGPGLYDYSAGGRWTDAINGYYCTVMTYQSGDYFDDGIYHVKVPYFSDPNISCQGSPTGDAVNANNSLTLRQIKSVISNYRMGNDILTNHAISSLTLTNGQQDCFNATQTIIVAGDGTSVTVESGGSANFIAGQKIRFLPGFHTQAGSYVHAEITTDGQYCVEEAPALVAEESNSEKEAVIVNTGWDELPEREMVVYPNPNSGEFTVEFRNFEGEIRVMLFNSIGQLVQEELTTEQEIRMSLPNLKRGMYFVKAVNKGEHSNRKIVVR